MVVRKTRADSLVGLKSAIWGKNLNAGGFEGIVPRECKLSMVEAVLVRAFLKAKNEEVPLEDVIFLGKCDKVGQVFPAHYLLVLRCKSLRHKNS